MSRDGFTKAQKRLQSLLLQLCSQGSCQIDSGLDWEIRHHSSSDEVVIIVSTGTAAKNTAKHTAKYIVAIGSSGRRYTVAVPLSIIKLHREILALLKQSTGEGSFTVLGGGYLETGPQGLNVYGASQDFGAADHQQAAAAFARTGRDFI